MTRPKRQTFRVLTLSNRFIELKMWINLKWPNLQEVTYIETQVTIEFVTGRILKTLRIIDFIKKLSLYIM